MKYKVTINLYAESQTFSQIVEASNKDEAEDLVLEHLDPEVKDDVSSWGSEEISE